MTRIHTPLLGLATLAALGLAAAHPQAAHAQQLTLQSGDNVAVGGFGSVNTDPTGTAVDPAATSYTSDGNYTVETNGDAMFSLESGGALTDNGGRDALFADGSGTVTIAGGTVSGSGNGLMDDGTGLVTVSGGALTASGDGFALLAGGNGPVTVSGGILSAGDGGIALFVDGAAATVSGGTLTAGDNGTALDAEGGDTTVTGGAFTTGAGGYALLTGGGDIDLYGQFTAPDGTVLLPGQEDMLNTGSGSFFGTLEDDTMEQTFTFQSYTEGITLHDVAAAPPVQPTPEPSAFVGLGIGLLGLGALAMKAQRRTA